MTPTGRSRVGRSYSSQCASEKGRDDWASRFNGLPDSILIALWVVTLGVVGSCWAVALVAWLIDGTTGAVLPLVIGGALAGAAEWIFRRDHR